MNTPQSDTKTVSQEDAIAAAERLSIEKEMLLPCREGSGGLPAVINQQVKLLRAVVKKLAGENVTPEMKRDGEILATYASDRAEHAHYGLLRVSSSRER